MDKGKDCRQDNTAHGWDQETIIAIVSKAWQDIADSETFSIHDTFYQMGGNSIVIMKVFTKLKNGYFPCLKLLDFFTYPTIQKLGTYLYSIQ